MKTLHPLSLSLLALLIGQAWADESLKADGVEYDERMELLDEVTWPKPLDELLTATYEMYARTHPWILDTPVSPKSVVRSHSAPSCSKVLPASTRRCTVRSTRPLV